MYALIDQNDKVVGIEATKFEVVETLTWAEIPAGVTVQFGFTYTAGQFTDPNAPDLPTVQQQQTHAVSYACSRQILSGFASSALGSAHTYAASEVDQRNLIAAAQATNGGLLVCQDSTGAWSRQPHTKPQAQQALDAFVTHRDTSRTLLGTLMTSISTASTIEAVQAIVWPSSPPNPAAAPT